MHQILTARRPLPIPEHGTPPKFETFEQLDRYSGLSGPVIIAKPTNNFVEEEYSELERKEGEKKVYMRDLQEQID